MKTATTVALALSLLVACQFDDSALDVRGPCDSESDCAVGVCIDGFCFAGDAGIDISEDTALDVVSDAESCVPTERICEQNDVRECAADGQSASIVEQCGDEAICYEGECEPLSCEPNAARCVGDLLIRCDAAGIVETEDCLARSRFCQEDAPDVAECVARVCEPGTTQCDGPATFATCDLRGSGYTTSDSCALGLVCEGGLCVSQCEPGDLRCNALGIPELCNASGEYAAQEPCAAGLMCVDGACGVVNSCEDGELQCLDQLTLQRCAANEWVSESCPTNTECRASGTVFACVLACEPGARRCDDNGVPEQCSIVGEAWNAQPACDVNSACIAGDCVEVICKPGSTECADATTLLTCLPDGQDTIATTCQMPQTCVEVDDGAQCSCEPGASRCRTADEPQLCNAAGIWQDAGACGDEGTCVAGACEPIDCSPGETSCLSERVIGVCNGSGTGFVPEDCATGNLCVPGGIDQCREVVCIPNARSCNAEGDIIACSAIGDTEMIVNCPGLCDDGICSDAVCGDGVISDSETCDDGNNNPCDGCDDCSLLRVQSSDGGMTTTDAGAAWVPGASDFTIELWVQLDTDTGYFAGIGETSGDNYAQLGVQANAPIFSYNLGGDDTVEVQSVITINDNDWHHIAAVRFERDAVIYLDGVPTGVSYNRPAQIPSGSIDGTGEIWIGGDGTAAGFHGSIDEVRFSATRIYDAPFVPERVLGARGDTMALYHFDSSDRAVAVDATGVRNLSLAGGYRERDDCYGEAANAIVCGDGNIAIWEACDGGVDCMGNCTVVTDCTDHLYNGSCYSLRGVATDFDIAQSQCEDDFDGNLVSIADAAENIVVRNVAGDLYAWIGFTDEDTENTFVWVDGSPTTYETWNPPSEPNDGSGGEDCTMLIPNGNWNDWGCSKNVRYVCER